MKRNILISWGVLAAMALAQAQTQTTTPQTTSPLPPAIPAPDLSSRDPADFDRASLRLRSKAGDDKRALLPDRSGAGAIDHQPV